MLAWCGTALQQFSWAFDCMLVTLSPPHSPLTWLSQISGAWVSGSNSLVAKTGMAYSHSLAYWMACIISDPLWLGVEHTIELELPNPVWFSPSPSESPCDLLMKHTLQHTKPPSTYAHALQHLTKLWHSLMSKLAQQDTWHQCLKWEHDHDKRMHASMMSKLTTKFKWF